jgi:signal transduction histidine kinase
VKSLYLRIWLTVVLALASFAAVSAFFVQRHVTAERERMDTTVRERVEAWADLLERSLPPASAPEAEQAAGLRDWALKLAVPLALDTADGRRIAASEAFLRRETEAPPPMRRALPVRLDDGRTLWVMRPAMRPLPGRREPAAGPPAGGRPPPPPAPAPWWTLPGWPGGMGLAALLGLLFVAVAAGAWPVVRHLTRRLEALQAGVEDFGAGQLARRVPEEGHDEVAAVAASFNRAAARVEALLRSHRSLLANASHELRSPLARLKVAVAMLGEAEGAAARRALQAEIDADIAELDAIVEEVLLSSRLEAAAGEAPPRREAVDLLALAAEEGARVGASAGGEAAVIAGDEKLLRRALRNLLENARRYGAGTVEVEVAQVGDRVEAHVLDRGAGVPAEQRERIFEPFFRLPGHAEREGGVGLGLALVRQIARAHDGEVVCAAREGGGSRFTLRLPAAPRAAGVAAPTPSS